MSTMLRCRIFHKETEWDSIQSLNFLKTDSFCIRECSDRAWAMQQEAWMLPIKGPVYVAMFTPFAIVLSVAMDVMLLGETLHIGSLIGAVAISIGFYMLMWGKAKEEAQSDVVANAEIHPNDDSNSSSSTEKVPLLSQNHAMGPV
ncbi:unnamed protein product [Linum tenue]|uniref:WAT1-related protein n=1 Tax=Linum tenue TaxID=586396 RepID=A0AAV0NAW3_9ROSI|nr:unnamed protein product [Linum tenue]